MTGHLSPARAGGALAFDCPARSGPSARSRRPARPGRRSSPPPAARAGAAARTVECVTFRRRGSGYAGRRPGYLAAAAVFAVGMAGMTLPTPLYGLYRAEIGFSELMVTVVFAVYAVGVIGVLL